jgi:hypothetical protein
MIWLYFTAGWLAVAVTAWSVTAIAGRTDRDDAECKARGEGGRG